MFNFSKIWIEFDFHAIWVIIGILLSLGFSIYYYRFTIPKISNNLRYLLVFIRFIAISSIVILLANARIVFLSQFEQKPKNLIFIDNSASIVNSDSSRISKKINQIISEFQNFNNYENQFIFFGDTLSAINGNNLLPNFSSKSTNFWNIYEFLRNNGTEIENIFIFSDGIANDGKIPKSEFAEIPIKINVIASGNEKLKTNLEIVSVTHNHTFLQNKNNPINARIFNNSNQNQSFLIFVNLGKEKLFNKNVNLQANEIGEFNFDVRPKNAGISNLSIEISKIPEELTYTDNLYFAPIEIEKSKRQILLITSSPNFDLSFIKQSLQKDSTLSVNSIFVKFNQTQLTPEQNKLISEANAMFFVNFPTKEVSNQIVKQVSELAANKSAFIQFTNFTDLQKLQTLVNDFPSKQKLIDFPNVQITSVQNHPIFDGINLQNKNFLSSFPPVNLNSFSQNVNPNILIYSQNGQNTFPILEISQNNLNNRAYFYASEIWRWKMQSSLENGIYFDTFFGNLAKWLITDSKKNRLMVNSQKPIISQNETVIFNLSVINQLQQPSDNHRIKLLIDNNLVTNFRIIEKQKGNFQIELENVTPGKHTINFQAISENDSLNKSLEILVLQENIEMQNLTINYNYLQLIAQLTNGKFTTLNQFNINDYLSEKQKPKLVILENNIRIFPNEFLLIFVIFAFSFEWFLRKRKNLL